MTSDEADAAGPPSGAPPGEPWWPLGWWVGPADVGTPLIPQLQDVCGRWHVGGTDLPGPPSVLVNATALSEDADLEAAGAVIEDLALGEAPPARIIAVVGAGWLGRGPTPAASARSSFVLAHARHLALRLAPSGSTVNVVAVPDGFPAAASGPHAPVRSCAGPADLANVLRYFANPANGYVIGQLLSLTGGDDVWSNHSL